MIKLGKNQLTCIRCPIGCELLVNFNENKVISVIGNGCKRGEQYGRKEYNNPTRMVTSSVEVNNGVLKIVSVKTETDIPKNAVEKCLKELKKVKVNAPVKIGDIIIKNTAGTGINVIATRNVPVHH